MSSSESLDILLIEDNDYDAELTMRAFKIHNIANSIFRYKDGQEALDFLFQTWESEEAGKRARPKLILLDLMLPGISGMELLQIIKSNPVTKMIPVVVLTSSTEEEDILKSYHLGVNSFISKPVEFDQFIEAVKHLGFYWLLLNKAP